MEVDCQLARLQNSNFTIPSGCIYDVAEDKVFRAGCVWMLVRERGDRSFDELDRRSRRAGNELTMTSSWL